MSRWNHFYTTFKFIYFSVVLADLKNEQCLESPRGKKKCLKNTTHPYQHNGPNLFEISVLEIIFVSVSMRI